MSATETVEGLIKAGTALKAAWANAKQSNPEMDLPTFVQSAEFGATYAQLSLILNHLTPAEVNQALREVRAKEEALLGGQSVMELPPERLAQYDALLDLENQLMRKYAAQAGKNVEWVSWLIDDALPAVLKIAKVVLPLLH